MRRLTPRLRGRTRWSTALPALILAAALCLIAACDSVDDSDASQSAQADSAQPTQEAEQQAAAQSETAQSSSTSARLGFVLQLLHASDMDGAAGALDNVESFSALLDGFRAQMPRRTLVLSSGDNFVPGPRFYAAADASTAAQLGLPGIGRADIALLNAMGFQASALGNHEFDLGPRTLAAIIAPEQGEDGFYSGAAFPYLSANLGLADDGDLLPLVAADGQRAPLGAGSLARSVILDVDGEQVGVVGATTPHLAWIAGVGDITVLPADRFDLDALAAIVQDEVDKLTAKGINKIILLAHMQQIEIELQLAGRLQHVDIIVAGGSNTILADHTDRLRPGDRAVHTYPLHVTSAVGEPILLVNTDADYRYLGRLVVRFDDRGVVDPASVDPVVSGAYASDDAGRSATSAAPIPEVSQIKEALQTVIRERDREVVARTNVYLAGRRIDVRTQETNLGNLVADAFLWTARQVDPTVAVALKNSGGIRAQIGRVWQPPGTNLADQVVYSPPAANTASGKQEGEITRFDIESVLRFNNALVIVPVTARQLALLLEHAIGFDGVGTTPDGRFPQVSGMRFSFDPSRATGERIQSLAVVDDDGRILDAVIVEGALVGNPEREIRMAVLNFTANGGDGYPFPQPLPGRVDLTGEEGQYNPPSPEFPDTNGNGVIDPPIDLDPGLYDFAAPGSEQDALTEYLAHFFAATPFELVETPPSEDRRIQNLAIPGVSDTVYESTESP